MVNAHQFPNARLIVSHVFQHCHDFEGPLNKYIKSRTIYTQKYMVAQMGSVPVQIVSVPILIPFFYERGEGVVKYKVY